MNDIKNKPKSMLRQFPDEIRADRWGILFFDKAGKSYRDPEDIFPNEEAAQDFITQLEKKDGHFLTDNANTWYIKLKDYSHAIPIPLGGE